MRKWFSLSCFGMALGLLCIGGTTVAQTAPAASAPASQAPQMQIGQSLGEELNSLNQREVHIFFIHGIGSLGPHSHDSESLRKSICVYVKNCVKPAGEQVGNYDYPDGTNFGLTEQLPTMRYMGKPIWNTPEEWHAAAPFVVHYKLARTTGKTIYLDELNWWPLVFALKCRQIIASDARLAGPVDGLINTCSTKEPDPQVPGRFISYDWISPDEAKQLQTQSRRAARINRSLKMDIMDWGFSDAVATLGPLRDLMVQGIRQLILNAVLDSPMTIRESTPLPLLSPIPDQDFVIVSHSLGSYLIFSALSVNAKDRALPVLTQASVAYMQVLRQTALVYFFANQVRLLELANLEQSSTDNFVSYLEDWGKLRCDYEKSAPGVEPNAPCRLPKIVALSDPSDLLTWRVPHLTTVDVQNVYVKNGIHWFWLLENPMRAHLNYSSDKRAIREMLHPTAAPDIEK